MDVEFCFWQNDRIPFLLENNQILDTNILYRRLTLHNVRDALKAFSLEKSYPRTETRAERSDKVSGTVYIEKVIFP